MTYTVWLKCWNLSLIARKMMWEKEKMLLIIICFVSHNIRIQKPFLSGSFKSKGCVEKNQNTPGKMSKDEKPIR